VAAALVAAAAAVFWFTRTAPNPPSNPPAQGPMTAGQPVTTPGPVPQPVNPQRPAPVEAPPQAPVIEPPPPPSFPVRQYTVQLTSTDGNGTGPEVTLRLDRTRLAVFEPGSTRPFRQIPYTAVRTATYSQKRSFRVVYRSTEHWLTLGGSGADLVLRLDKRDYEAVLQEIAKRTGVTVSRKN
jgi:hypothetical protein